MIATVIENMTAKQSKIIGYTLNKAYKAGTKEGDKLIKGEITAAAVSFDLSKVSDTHLNKITKGTIGHIGKYNAQLSKQLTLEYKTLLADNVLMIKLAETGWSPAIEKALTKRGISAEVIALVKGQSSTAKMISILEMQGMRAGRNPREIGRLLQPAVTNYFGKGGVIINNVGKTRRVFTVNADGAYKWVRKRIIRPYRATPKSYASLVARSSMHSAHLEGRYGSLQKSNLVDHYVSQSILDARTCPKCAKCMGYVFQERTGRRIMEIVCAF